MGNQQAIHINSMSLDEWQARVDLAACYRLIAHFGMDDLIYTHISARIPGPEEHFLRNHGLLTCGRSIPEAFIMMYYIEQACRIQIAAQAGSGIHLPPKDVQDLAHAQAMTGLGVPIGSREFAALKRRLDRLGADYAR